MNKKAALSDFGIFMPIVATIIFIIIVVLVAMIEYSSHLYQDNIQNVVYSFPNTTGLIYVKFFFGALPFVIFFAGLLWLIFLWKGSGYSE